MLTRCRVAEILRLNCRVWAVIIYTAPCDMPHFVGRRSRSQSLSSLAEDVPVALQDVTFHEGTYCTELYYVTFVVSFSTQRYPLRKVFNYKVCI